MIRSYKCTKSIPTTIDASKYFNKIYDDANDIVDDKKKYNCTYSNLLRRSTQLNILSSFLCFHVLVYTHRETHANTHTFDGAV